MRNEKDAGENSSVGLTSSMPWRISEVQPLDNYRLHVKFIDGTEGYANLSSLIMSDDAGVFIALRDIQVFNNVHLEYGAVTWPGELDLAPDAMYHSIKANGEYYYQ